MTKEKIKFELMSDSIDAFGIKLFRIKAKVDGKYYKKGEIGGYVESLKLKNGDARVSGNAWVSGYALVSQWSPVSTPAKMAAVAVAVPASTIPTTARTIGWLTRSLTFSIRECATWPLASRLMMCSSMIRMSRPWSMIRIIEGVS